SIEGLSKAKSFKESTATGTDEFINVSSDTTAQLGSFDIKVNNLAQAHKSMTSTFTDAETVGSGTLTFATADGSSSFDIVVDPADTLANIRNKINDSTDNTSTIATIITEADGAQRLVMSSKKTGIDNAINVTAASVTGRLADFTTANLTELTPAKDASITVDGAIILTSATNEFKDAIQGVTIDVLKAHDVEDKSTLGIEVNNKLVEEGLESYVTAYNELSELVKKMSKAGNKEKDEKSGVLSGDSMLRSVTSKLRNFLSSSFGTASGGTMALTQLGVTADRYGKLTFDKEKLTEQLSDNPLDVQAFFIGTDSTPGFGASMDTFINSYTESYGLVDSRVEGYNKQMTRLDDSMESFTMKMDKYEARLYSQYNAMDALVANLSSTGSFVMSQLNSMPGVVRNRN
ncbi:MAG: flagellar filament capping protein FliD, partial [Psychrobium sp.]|nr:flagellar filament capping protein FliD [Psychrobium sp.]